MIKHLPVNVLKDVAMHKITKRDKKIIHEVGNHNSNVMSAPKESVSD